MPNYDFRCQDCGKEFTKNVPIKDKDSVVCESCGGKVKQVFRSVGFLKAGCSTSAGGFT